ncbi:MAG: hypothetical protein UU95_C0011G0015 [Parcubacteria group bacterium GW2011_GWC2_42_12]|nr:MAG: hypothetical protein UU95_C0011G0015 [Parcubacteria group bacterium GW2011_GWC2_42_12]
MLNIIPGERTENKILLMRGLKVMLDRDLAELYGVETKVLNQAVKRNRKRFPDDFMFQLSKAETDVLVTNCDSSSLPYVFTEQGVAMLSSILNSERAILVNVAIMRTFVNIRKFVSTYEGLAMKIAELEKKYDKKIGKIFETLDKFNKTEDKNKREIGFRG